MLSESWKRRARPLLVLVVSFSVITSVAALVLWATIPARPVPINVRWKTDVSDAQRASLERQFGLTDGHVSEGTTWAYLLTNASSSNIRAIVQHPRVDDTAHLNRRWFRPEAEYDRPRVIAVRAAMIGAAGAVVVAGVGALNTLGPTVVVAQPSLTRLVIVAPMMLATGGLVVLLLAAFGYDPLWRQRDPANLSEAAAGRDRAMLAKMIEAGADPNAPAPVNRDGRVVMMTPLEAAMMSRDEETVALLVRMGARR